MNRKIHIHWFEAKQLDRVTNYSSRTEIIKNISNSGIDIHYYCSFASSKKYYGLERNIKYLGIFKNKYLKYIEFSLLCKLKSFFIVLFSNNNVIISNQQLVYSMRYAHWLNLLLHKTNKFVLDVRTLPTSPESFEKDMIEYDQQIKYATKFYDGLSFITPFLKKITLDRTPTRLPTVTWSSGVDVNLFNANCYDYKRDNSTFRIFYHGGISESRGNIDLMKACAIVVKRGYDIELIQIGKIVDKSVREFIENNHYESWCHLYEAKPLKEIPALVAKCDLPLLPFPDFLAWRVSSPIKLMEYLAMGKPVMVPNMECFTDILPSNSSLVYYYDLHAQNLIDEMANAIIQCINSRDNNMEYIKENGCINYVTENFTWKIQAEKLLQFCLNL